MSKREERRRRLLVAVCDAILADATRNPLSHRPENAERVIRLRFLHCLWFSLFVLLCDEPVFGAASLLNADLLAILLIFIAGK